MKRICVVIALLLVCDLVVAQPILMLGNSFTGGVHPQIRPNPGIDAFWVGGWNLDQHFNNADSRAAVCRQRSHVVLQDFSTRASDNALFQFDIDEMVPLVRSCGATPVLFMTWETNFIDYETVRRAYQSAASRHQIPLIAVGTVWHEIRLSDGPLFRALLQSDGKHPTERGGKVGAASMLYAFCETCYQSFDWRGFSAQEIVLIRSIIERTIVRIEQVQTPEPELADYLSLILLLLL